MAQSTVLSELNTDPLPTTNTCNIVPSLFSYLDVFVNKGIKNEMGDQKI